MNSCFRCTKSINTVPILLVNLNKATGQLDSKTALHVCKMCLMNMRWVPDDKIQSQLEEQYYGR